MNIIARSTKLGIGSMILGLAAGVAIGALAPESVFAKGRDKTCEAKCMKANMKPDLNPAALAPLCDSCCNWDEPTVKRPTMCRPYHGTYCMLSNCNPI